MVDVHYTLHIGHPNADRNWMIDKYDTLDDVNREAELFSSCGFWVSIRKHEYKRTSKETLLVSTWNRDIKFKSKRRLI